jgi:recombinational DNA repair protein (RecF pathway)
MHYRKSYEIVGYSTKDGEFLCLSCAHAFNESGSPIFLDHINQEEGLIECCDSCMIPLEEQ